jgi:2-succinyl-5-enolpyruvyl-6-hydroxy-3-cyclohexene-1-carboxylate synthase
MCCNRGTSGIDGSTSTAMGFAIKNENPTLLITGDLSFFYDINGLWNQYIPPFVRIMIFNNGEEISLKLFRVQMPIQIHWMNLSLQTPQECRTFG